MIPPILDLQDISVRYPAPPGSATRWRLAVDTVSLTVGAGEIVGLVGESGCGKSTIARAAMRLVPVCAGAVCVNGIDIGSVPPRQMRSVRSVVQMVFQDPFASLNPRMSIYDALAEPLRMYRKTTSPGMDAAVNGLLDSVGVAAASARRYPHEFSGGQRQRIAIARCLAVNPALIIADEPVSSLDVSVQAQILNLLCDISRQRGLAMLFISHDLSIVRYLCSTAHVMHGGKIIEQGPTQELFSAPRQEYTRNLLAAIPKLK